MSNSPIYRILHKSTEKGIPLTCTLELTKRCNLSCIHCYVVNDKRRELNFYEIKDILLQIKDAGVLFLILTGGEVFLRNDFLKIVNLVRRLKFATKIFTNGTLIGKKEAFYIAEVQPLEIGISIYSDKSYIHDMITRTENSFYNSISAIKYLREKNLNVKIKCPVMRLNFKSIDGVKKIADDMGCFCQFDFVIAPKDNGDKNPTTLRCSFSQIKKIMRKSNLKAKYSNGNLICNMGKTHFAISSDGGLYPCLQYRIRCGSLKSKSFHKIWYNSTYLKKIRNLSMNDLIECRDCTDRFYCMRCPGVAHLEGRATFFCTLAKIFKEHNGSIQKHF